MSFLYYEDCPSYDLALERLREVMAEESIPGEVEVIKVDTEDQARELRFVGSPTIRVDGQDIDPPRDFTYALTCRAYSLGKRAQVVAFQTRGILGLGLPPEPPPGPSLRALLGISRSRVWLSALSGSSSTV